MEIEPTGRYYDGVVASRHFVTLALTRDASRPELIIADRATREELDRWPVDSLFEVEGPGDALSLGTVDRPYGARVRVPAGEWSAALREAIPGLGRRALLARGQQRRILGIAVAALASVIAAYVFGVPVLAGSVTPLVPSAWETRLGEGARLQVEGMLSNGRGFQACGGERDAGNIAISRFAADVIAESGSPFTPKVTVVRSPLTNAFALPGGQVYYFSGLLDRTETADEFAGVLAHELGHVAHRHSMQMLIESSATGLLVGFVLGDMTNLSIAAAAGVTLIDSRFSRQAEHEADAFAGAAGNRLGFSPLALADLLERVAADDTMTRSLALLNTHPLTDERRAALEALPVAPSTTRSAFSEAEWRAIKSMC
ncbi:M48 family metallopeptidase [Devosia sp. A16]|uniref:M48 family metallopeptidase n=1 Tax=Devosia sp. A16 TaxID=1736675 RepID=UPI0006D791CA|nr:M48 family metallopeptidase [Devosia sp. A16]